MVIARAAGCTQLLMAIGAFCSWLLKARTYLAASEDHPHSHPCLATSRVLVCHVFAMLGFNVLPLSTFLTREMVTRVLFLASECLS
jgi:hypothetical protein